MEKANSATQLDDSFFSPTIDPTLHPNDELVSIIRTRACEEDIDEFRKSYLTTTGLKNQQLIERIQYDNQILLLEPEQQKPTPPFKLEPAKPRGKPKRR